MAKQAVSVTLETDNLAWLRGRARAEGRRSVSDMLDRLIREARAGGRGSGPGIRSVVGTVRISTRDPLLEDADRAVRPLFVRALARGRRPPRPAKTRSGRGG